MKEVIKKTAPESTADRVGRFIDRCIYAVAPELGIQRMASRHKLVTAQAHEAAEYDRLRENRWLTSKLSPDSALEEELDTVRDRSRDVYRNDSTGGVVDMRVAHVIGRGFTPQAKVEDPKLAKSLEDIFRRWSIRADKSRQMSLWQLACLAEAHCGFDGEDLTVLSDVGDADSPIPLAIEVIDPMRLETPPDRTKDPLTRLGIEHDAKGRIVAYHIRRKHPGDTRDLDLTYDRIPKNRVLHVFRPMFAGQSRGMAWMVRVLNRVRDAKDLDEATIIKAQVEACYSAFVTTNDEAQSAARNAARGGTDVQGKPLQELSPGLVKYLNKGEDVKFTTPGTPGATFEAFMQWNQRRMAAGTDMPYEMLSKNWSGVSFAGGRLVLAGARRTFSMWQKLRVERWLMPIWDRMVEESIIVGAVKVQPRAYSADPWSFKRHVWIPPVWDYSISPREEVDAAVEEVNNNLRTKAEVVAERTGRDLQDVMDERQAEHQMEIDRDIVPPQPGKAVPAIDKAQLKEELQNA